MDDVRSSCRKGGLLLPDYRFAACIPLSTASNRTFPHTCRLGRPESIGGTLAPSGTRLGTPLTRTDDKSTSCRCAKWCALISGSCSLAGPIQGKGPGRRASLSPSEA